MRVENKLAVHEVDGVEPGPDNLPEPLVVNSHWNARQYVEVTLGSKRVTVAASELRKAIDNCTNT